MNDKVVKQVNCVYDMACFVDDREHALNQKKENNFVHWLSVDKKYKDVKIKFAHCIDDIDVVILVDTLNQVRIF